jgi:hypothetical protein
MLLKLITYNKAFHGRRSSPCGLGPRRERRRWAPDKEHSGKVQMKCGLGRGVVDAQRQHGSVAASRAARADAIIGGGASGRSARKVSPLWPNNALQATALALRARASLASLGAPERGRWAS